MKKNTDIWKWLMPAWLLASSCVHEELVNEYTVDKDPASHPYVVLRIAVPSEGTRANPMGGEEGNGREEGILKENVINNLNVYFYSDAAGLDADAGTPILHHIYYNLQNPEDPDNTDVTIEWKDESAAGRPFFASRYLELAFKKDNRAVYMDAGVKFAVLANSGKITPANLGALRDFTLLRAVKSLNPKEADDFVMSTAFNENYTVGGVSTGTNTLQNASSGSESASGYSLVGTTTVERLVARIDLWYNAADNAKIQADAAADAPVSRLEYVAEGSQNKVYVTNVLPVNVMQIPSYIFKKVTNLNQPPAFSWWTASNLSSASYLWGGAETPNVGVAGSDLPTNYVVEPTTIQKTQGGRADKSNEWYGATSAVNVMSTVTSTANGSVSTYHNLPLAYDSEYKCDRISVISYANENTHPVDCFNSSYLTGLAFRGHYVPTSIYSAYNAETDALTEIADKNSVRSIWRYSPSVPSGVTSEQFALYFSSKNAADAYRNAHPSENGILTPFDAVLEDGLGLGFTCYYNLWLRHFNDESADPKTTYPMEYATVRNNIYRVAISFTGPGDPTPTMRQPDTMQARIFVRKWNQRVEESALEY